MGNVPDMVTNGKAVDWRGPMDPLKLAWAAGLIDGEGCISLLRYSATKSGPRSRSPGFRLILKVSMCCKTTIDTLIALFKVGSRSSRVAKPGERMSTSYSWICNAGQVRAVLPLIRPYLVTKAQEADVALSFLALGYANRGGAKGSPIVEAELLAARQEHFEKLRALKSRSKFRRPKPAAA